MGAAAVQVGTVSFIRPRAAATIVEEISGFLAERGIRRLDAWRGCLMSGAIPAGETRPGRLGRAGGKSR